MPLELDPLRKSYEALAKLLLESENAENMEQFNAVVQDAIWTAIIKKFEITYELAWKLMKKWLKTHISPNIADGLVKREFFRLASEHRLILDVDVWMRYHNSRNDTAHNYDCGRADMVHEVTGEFLHDIHRLLEILEAKNDD